MRKRAMELITDFDYQVLNNGMMGWLTNDYYKDVFEFVEILNERNLDIDKTAADIFKKATVAGLEFFSYQKSLHIPEIKTLSEKLEEDIVEYGNAYSKIAKSFMASYSMEDYITKIHKQIFGTA